MTHTDVDRTLDRLKREVVILCEMQEKHPAPEDTNANAVHNRLILAQSKKVRTASNMLVRAIARERDELHPHPEWSNIVRPMIRDYPQLQP